MTSSWAEFEAAAPRIAAIFRRRHAATGDLCMLGTLRPDGWPRLSPMEPRLFEERLWIYGMPRTAKFDDLARDPRFTLHTATVDTHVGDGDAKLWGTVRDVQDDALHARLAQDLFEKTASTSAVRSSSTATKRRSSERRRSRSSTAISTSPPGVRARRDRAPQALNTAEREATPQPDALRSA